ncbi:MAG: hypothetical protein FD123_3612 [Bacteroidetes bacterium]|nr:MAG: hypothetical protein FD123_3612 [Bacteroidota bacterium]
MTNQPEKKVCSIRYRGRMTGDELSALRKSRLWTEIAKRYLFLPLTFDYYSEYHQGEYADRVFFVYCGDEPLLAFWGLCKAGRLGYFHLPAEITAAPASAEAINEAYRQLLGELENIVKRDRVSAFEFEYDPYLVSAYFGKMSQVSVKHSCIVDLELGEEQIKGNVRKSYKSLINWGSRELRTAVMDSSNADPELYEQVKQFHFRVAGRKTRSDASWQKHYASIAAGEGYLVTAFFGEQMASAALVLHGSAEAFYGVGINDRELMEKHPVSHYPLLAAILHAKKIGLKKFNMNDVDILGTDEKADSISMFKKGFSKTLLAHTSYLVQTAAPADHTKA